MNPTDIKLLRQLLGLTQENFGALIGCAANTIVRWEKGTSKPSPVFIKQIKKLAKPTYREKKHGLEACGFDKNEFFRRILGSFSSGDADNSDSCIIPCEGGELGSSQGGPGVPMQHDSMGLPADDQSISRSSDLDNGIIARQSESSRSLCESQEPRITESQESRVPLKEKKE